MRGTVYDGLAEGLGCGKDKLVDKRKAGNRCDVMW